MNTESKPDNVTATNGMLHMWILVTILQLGREQSELVLPGVLSYPSFGALCPLHYNAWSTDVTSILVSQSILIYKQQKMRR